MLSSKFLAPTLLALLLPLVPVAARAAEPVLPITFTISRTTISESDGPQATRVVIRRVPGTGSAAIRVQVRLENEGGFTDSVLSAPSQVLVPEGQDSAEFFLSARENLLVEPIQRKVRLKVLVPGFILPTELTIKDTTPRLSVSVAPTTVREGGPDAVGTVRLTRPTPFTVRVNLRSNDPRVAVPSTVTVPPGAVTASFAVRIVSDGVLSKPGPFNTISFGSNIGNAVRFGIINLVILDDRTRFSLDIRPTSIKEGGSTARGVIRVASATASDRTFLLYATDHTSPSRRTQRISTPLKVVLAAGSTSVAFDITAVDNSVADGNAFVQLSAQAEGDPSNFARGPLLEVQDNDSAPSS